MALVVTLLFFCKNSSFYFVLFCFLCVCLGVRMCTIWVWEPSDKQRCLIPHNESYRWLWVALCALRVEPRLVEEQPMYFPAQPSFQPPNSLLLPGLCSNNRDLDGGTEMKNYNSYSGEISKNHNPVRQAGPLVFLEVGMVLECMMLWRGCLAWMGAPKVKSQLSAIRGLEKEQPHKEGESLSPALIE